jgi:hypothetical protein
LKVPVFRTAEVLNEKFNLLFDNDNKFDRKEYAIIMEMAIRITVQQIIKKSFINNKRVLKRDVFVTT